MLADQLPRVLLAHLPTPLVELPRLTKALGGPRILLKRDDQTGLAGGGNKARKLEFAVADAIEQGADTLVTMGGVQSNHCRQTAAAAAAYGLDCTLLLNGSPPSSWNGNLLLDRILGAQVIFCEDRSRDEVVTRSIQELQEAGHHPYLIPAGASNAVGAMGYVVAMEELDRQLREQDGRVDRIIVGSGSGGTQAGLCAGAKAIGFEPAITGISVSKRADELQTTVARIANAASARLGLGISVTPEEVIVLDAYTGGGYAVMGEPELEAIDLVARTEGILLDPVYTGRAMAGLIDLIRTETIHRDETIVFWHTGGSAALFAYADHWVPPGQ